MAEDQVNDDRDDRSLIQRVAGLTWDLCNPPVPAAVMAEHERIMGIQFPDDFRAVIQQCPGGHPIERCDFWIDHPGYGRIGSGLGDS